MMNKEVEDRGVYYMMRITLMTIEHIIESKITHLQELEFLNILLFIIFYIF